jgi:hypothetical protein
MWKLGKIYGSVQWIHGNVHLWSYRIQALLQINMTEALNSRMGISTKSRKRLMGWAYVENPACSGLTKTRIQYGSVRSKTGVSREFKESLLNGLGADTRSHRVRTGEAERSMCSRSTP